MKRISLRASSTLPFLAAVVSFVPVARCQSAAELAAQARKMQAAETRGNALKEEAAEAELRQNELVTLEKEIGHARQTGNATFFRRVYSDDFIGTVSTGRIIDKQTFLTDLQNSADKYSSFVVTDIRVRLFQDTAVVTSLWSAMGDSAGHKISRQWRVTHVYVYGQRGWQTVASQETLLAG